jgi:tetratricopeptide (TPR) repeat protein
MRERIAARNPEDARAQDQLGYAFRARARLWRQAGDRAAARQDYRKAHTIYTDLRARGYGGAYAGSELGVTALALGEVSKEEGRQAEACQWFRQSAAVYGELAARDAVLPNHREDAENARRAAAACGQH